MSQHDDAFDELRARQDTTQAPVILRGPVPRHAGTGAAVGAFLAWLDRDATLTKYLFLLIVALIAAFVGASIGLQRGTELDAYKLVGTPGIPALSVAIIGAVLGANIPLVVIGLVNGIRDPRI